MSPLRRPSARCCRVAGGLAWAGLSRTLGFPLACGWWRAKSLMAVRRFCARLPPHSQAQPSLVAVAVAAARRARLRPLEALARPAGKARRCRCARSRRAHRALVRRQCAPCATARATHSSSAPTIPWSATRRAPPPAARRGRTGCGAPAAAAAGAAAAPAPRPYGDRKEATSTVAAGWVLRAPNGPRALPPLRRRASTATSRDTGPTRGVDGELLLATKTYARARREPLLPGNLPG
jgi:hypothetical protein